MPLPKMRPPTGQRLQHGLVTIFRQQLAEARAALQRDQVADLRHYTPRMVEQLQPLVQDLLQQSSQDLVRRLQPALARRHKRLTNLGRRLLALIQPRLQEAAQRLTLQFCTETNRTSTYELFEAREQLRRELAEGLTAGESARKLAARVRAIFATPRALTIARTEASRATHQGLLLAAEESGVVTGLQWLTPSDSCALCQPLNGQIVALGEPFVVLAGRGPYSRVTAPPYHPHCRCSVKEILGDEWT
jgi:hypothetical protein